MGSKGNMFTCNRSNLIIMGVKRLEGGGIDLLDFCPKIDKNSNQLTYLDINLRRK